MFELKAASNNSCYVIHDGYHLTRAYQLIKVFTMYMDVNVFIYKDLKSPDVLVSSKPLADIKNRDDILFISAFENDKLPLIDVNFRDFWHRAAAKYPQSNMFIRNKHILRKDISKLWQFVLKLLPANITYLYRIGVPTSYLKAALACRNLQEIKEKVLHMSNMHPKLMKFPPSWKNIAKAADAMLTNKAIDNLKPLQIVNIVKAFRHVQYVISIDAIVKHIEQGDFDYKSFMESVKYLNIGSNTSKMHRVVASIYHSIGMSHCVSYSSGHRIRPLDYKYVYAMVYRKGSPKCIASYDRLLPYR